MQHRKGGKIMSIEASTAALDRFCQEIILPSGDVERATRLAVEFARIKMKKNGLLIAGRFFS
jgi:hypothetical protein